MKKIEKLFLATILLSTPGVYMFLYEDGFFEVGISCFSSAVTLLVVAGLVAVIRRLKNASLCRALLATWLMLVGCMLVVWRPILIVFCEEAGALCLWLSVAALFGIVGVLIVVMRLMSAAWGRILLAIWFVFACVIIGLYGPAYFAADADVYGKFCEGMGCVNFLLAVIWVLFYACSRLFGERSMHGVVVSCIVMGACMCSCFYFTSSFDPAVLGRMILALVVFGALIWLDGDADAMVRYKNHILYPCLVVLLVTGMFVGITDKVVGEEVSRRRTRQPVQTLKTQSNEPASTTTEVKT